MSPLDLYLAVIISSREVILSFFPFDWLHSNSSASCSHLTVHPLVVCCDTKARRDPREKSWYWISIWRQIVISVPGFPTSVFTEKLVDWALLQNWLDCELWPVKSGSWNSTAILRDEGSNIRVTFRYLSPFASFLARKLQYDHRWNYISNSSKGEWTISTKKRTKKTKRWIVRDPYMVF